METTPASIVTMMSSTSCFWLFSLFLSFVDAKVCTGIAGAFNGGCKPNCDDGVSYCDLGRQACANDGFGKCIDAIDVPVYVSSIYPVPVAIQLVTAAGSIAYQEITLPVTQYVTLYVDATEVQDYQTSF